MVTTTTTHHIFLDLKSKPCQAQQEATARTQGSLLNSLSTVINDMGMTWRLMQHEAKLNVAIPVDKKMIKVLEQVKKDLEDSSLGAAYGVTITISSSSVRHKEKAISKYSGPDSISASMKRNKLIRIPPRRASKDTTASGVPGTASSKQVPGASSPAKGNASR